MGVKYQPLLHSVFVEYRARFEEPAVEQWHQGRVMQALLRALTRWGASLDSLFSGQPSAKVGDIRASVDLAQLGTMVNAGIGEIVVTRNHPRWADRDETVALAQAAITALQSTLGVAVGLQEVAVVLHASVPTRSPRELIGRFMNLDAPLVRAKNVRSFGVSVYRDDGYWVLDVSRVYPEAVFVRFGRLADGETTLETLARELHRDQVALAEALEVMGGEDASDPAV